MIDELRILLARTTAGKGFAKNDNVRPDVVPLEAEHLTGSAKTSLNLITDQKNVVFLADLSALGKVTIVRNEDTVDGSIAVTFWIHKDEGDLPRFTLNGLNQEGCNFIAVLLEHLLQILGVIVPDQPGVPSRADVFQERTKTSPRLRVGGHRDNTNSPSVEVTLDRKDLCLAVGNLLLLVTPLTRELDGSLNGLGTSVHR